MLIGLVGFIGSGKGTVGDILCDFGFTKHSFAGPVKDVASVMFNWPRNSLEGDTVESRTFRETPCKFWSTIMGRDFTPREALQKLGTEVGRDYFNKNFWVHRLQQRLSYYENIVLTDTRFPNEIKWIHQQGGIVIEVQRGENPDWYYDFVDYNQIGSYNKKPNVDIHPSETAWIGEQIDATIHNDGTLEDLRVGVENVLTKFYGKSKIDLLLKGSEYETI